MFFTIFVSPDVKLHITDSTKASEFIQKHVGQLVSPPHTAETLASFEPFKETVLEMRGGGWREALEDIVIPGLGWVSMTGSGSATVTVSAPSESAISLRPALLPFEAAHSTATYTGGRIEKKSGKGKKVDTKRWKGKLSD